MSAHILVPQVDASPASISSRFLTEILRRDWDYKGLVISDSIVMKGITSDHDSIERVALAMLNAGTDLLCLGGKLLNETAQDELTPQDVIRIHSYLVDCVKQGTLSEKRLNESVQRILDAKEQYARLYEGHLEEVANIDSKLLVEEIRLLARLSMKFSYDLKKKIAQQIWQNECGSSYDKLLFWNENERFLSLGIAHMIWYPEGVEKSFEEGFPNYIDFLKRQGFEVPDWLQKHCPWKTREEFVKERKSIKALELASWLQKTFDLQGLYLLHRLQTTLHKILKEASIEKRQDLLRILDTITASPAGLYALIDYVNFKGSGLIPTETYQGKGWGLCQVLAELSHDESRPVIERFTESAQKALINRVANAPSKEEEKWLKGWLNRVQTYLYFECN